MKVKDEDSCSDSVAEYQNCKNEEIGVFIDQKDLLVPTADTEKGTTSLDNHKDHGEVIDVEVVTVSQRDERSKSKPLSSRSSPEDGEPSSRRGREETEKREN